jgi:hypothetical protein
METTMQRRLVSIRRRVPMDRIEEYVPLWLQLHAAVTSRGAHAWNFISADVPEVYLEFLEFGTETDIRADEATVEAIRALHEAFHETYPAPQTIEEWVAVPAPPTVA